MLFVPYYDECDLRRAVDLLFCYSGFLAVTSVSGSVIVRQTFACLPLSVSFYLCLFESQSNLGV